MQITLEVASYNGAPLMQSLAATFDELGGTIGRADNNQLVLPDPERTISRVHAQVVFRNGSFAVVDRGSNPVAVNGRPIGQQQQAPLKHGDMLRIGGYDIRVSLAGAAGSAAHDPFADLMGSSAPASPPPRAAGGAASLDPLAGFGIAPAAPAARGSSSSVSSSGGIPEDWDPFAPDTKAASPVLPLPGAGGGFGLASGSGVAAPLGGAPSGMVSGNEPSIDALFGLGPASGGDPLANSLLDAPLAQPNTAEGTDPMRSLVSATRGSAAPAADNASDLHRAFVPQALSTPARAAPDTAAPPPALAGAVLSWDESAAPGHTIIRPGAKAVSQPRAADASSSPVPQPIPQPAPPPAAVASPRAAAAPSAPSDALAAAFCEGLGIQTLPGGALTPDAMRLVGELLRTATQGTVELLIARATLKREVHADVTQVVARANNPLKFSPDAEVALGYLLGPPMAGFMAPAPAMRDAYDDLRAHQFAVLAGMRAALDGVLARFDPKVLEEKLGTQSVFASLLPSSRKAQLWELFEELFGELSAEAADDFHELFGKAFVRAYEAHIDELKKGEPT